VKRTLAIDFDGVLHAYSKGWQDGTIYDRPLFFAVEALRRLRLWGYTLVIFTARKDTQAVKEWLAANDFPTDIEVTNVKPPAWAYIDDRAIRFENWAQCLDSIQSLSASGKAGEP
jgi:hypothetical protein